MALLRVSRLAHRFLLLYLVGGAVAGVLVIGFVHPEISSRIEEDLSHRQQDAAEKGSLLVRAYVGDLEAHLETLAFMPDMASVKAGEQARLMELLLERESSFLELSALDRQGMETARVSRAGLAAPGDLADRSTEPSFRAAMHGESFAGQAHFSAPGLPQFVLAYPITRDGGVVGVLRGTASLAGLTRELTSLRETKTDVTYLVDERGYLLAHPDPSRLSLGARLEGRPVISRIVSGEPVAARAPDSYYVNEKGKKVIATAVVLEGLDWGLVSETELAEFSAPLRRASIAVFLGVVVAVVVALSGVLYFTRRWFRPVGVLLSGAGEMAAGNLGHRVKISSRDEFEDLGRAFNNVAESLQQSMARMIETERMATIGQMAAIMAHELRNPLGVIGNALFYAKMRLGRVDEKLAQHTAAASRAIASASRIIEDLLDYTRPKTPSLQPVSLNSLLEGAITDTTIGENVSVVRSFASDLIPLPGDPEMLRRVFLNLLLNAVQAMPHGGTLEARTRLDGEWQEARVADTGVGIPPEVQAKLFQPLFSTKAKGVGLGLYISRDIIAKHGGAISIASEPGRGTAVTVRLPGNRKETHAEP